MPKFKDRTGEKFGKLTVVKPSERRGHNGGVFWVCACECGKECEVRSDCLSSGNNTSCGCVLSGWQKAGTLNRRHGLYKTPEYRIWQHMVARCTNPNHKAAKYYSDRGITICDRWRKFENFFADMGKRPAGLTLERIDSNGNYCPENCKWATWEEQSRNKSSNIFIEKDGERLCASDWAKKLGWSQKTIVKWLKRGMPISKLLVKKETGWHPQ